MILKKFSYIFLSVLFLCGFSFGLDGFNVRDTSDYIRTDNVQQVVNDEGITDPLRQGTANVGTKMNGTLNDYISNSNIAQSQTLSFFKGIMNYFLGLLALIALLYLLYHGFMIVTGVGNDEKYKKGFRGVKMGTIALLGIGLSWFVVSMIFYLINLVYS